MKDIGKSNEMKLEKEVIKKLFDLVPKISQYSPKLDKNKPRFVHCPPTTECKNCYRRDRDVIQKIYGQSDKTNFQLCHICLYLEIYKNKEFSEWWKLNFDENSKEESIKNLKDIEEIKKILIIDKSFFNDH